MVCRKVFAIHFISTVFSVIQHFSKVKFRSMAIWINDVSIFTETKIMERWVAHLDEFNCHAAVHKLPFSNVHCHNVFFLHQVHWEYDIPIVLNCINGRIYHECIRFPTANAEIFGNHFTHGAVGILFATIATMSQRQESLSSIKAIVRWSTV